MVSVRICTRPSKLAIIQAEMVSQALKDKGLDTVISKVHSSGDNNLTSPIHKLGGTGIFVEEVNKKILDGEGDIAVHSAKDLPSELPEELEILGVMPREDPSDVLISEYDLTTLPRGSVIGTSSIRRIHELRMLRPDLRIENLRGNLDTRVRKLQEGHFAGIILARAGLNRMAIEINFTNLGLDDFLPAPNQGIIAVVGMRDSPYADRIRQISHENTYREMLMERKLVSRLKLGCSLPAAVLCRKDGPVYRLKSRFYSLGSREYKEFSRTFSDIDEIDSLAKEIVEKVPRSYGFHFGER